MSKVPKLEKRNNKINDYDMTSKDFEESYLNIKNHEILKFCRENSAKLLKKEIYQLINNLGK